MAVRALNRMVNWAFLFITAFQFLLMPIRNAIILAAGYGTRLGGYAKPLLEIGGKPLISHIVSKLEDIPNMENIFVITNGLYCQKFREWSENISTKPKLIIINNGTVSNETRLGALKDIVFALNFIYKDSLEDTLIITGDNIFENRMADIFQHYFNEPLIGLYDVDSLEKAGNFGVVQVDSKNMILNFDEKPQAPKSTLISTGIYFYPAKTLRLLKKYVSDGNKTDRLGDFLAWLLENSQQIFGFKLEGKWWDIGSIESLESARAYYDKI